MCFTNGEEVGESSRDQSERQCKQLEDEFASLEAQELNTFNMEVSGPLIVFEENGGFIYQYTKHIN